ncbi:MAG: GatB/YqeY domain-containing protein [Xanthobacter sp.]
MLRDDINAALKEALKAQEKRRLATLRLVNAALKDRDIEHRGQGKDPLNDDELRALLAKMVKQREESARLYDEGGRPDLADREREEIVFIKAFLPQQLCEADTRAAIKAIITEIDAKGIKDMGRTMALLKERHAGALDFGKASQWVKEALTAAAAG